VNDDGTILSIMSLQTTMIGDLAVTACNPPNAGRPPILLIHGILGGPWYFEGYQRFFGERGYPSHAVSLRGRPGSRGVRDLGRIALEEFVTDAREVARSLGRPIIIGHSMGGLIAQRLAEDDVSDIVVLLSSAPSAGIRLTTPRLAMKQIRHLGTLLRLKPLRSSRSDSDDLIFNRMPAESRADLHARLLPDSALAAREMALGSVRVDERKVRCALLIASGMDDRFIAPRVARQLAKKYGAPCWQYPRNGHFLPMEPGWERIAGDVESWIGRRVDQASSLSPRGAT
jgi:pimeloyl-ACP methyl ester carboxylesterase